MIRPTNKKPGIRLKILEQAKAQGLTLNQISERLNIHPYILEIYSTQVLLKEKLEDPKIQADINNIADALGTTLVELSVSADPPIMQLRLSEFLQEKGISREELSLLYDVPSDFFDLLDDQPFDFSLINTPEGAATFCCKIFGGFCCR